MKVLRKPSEDTERLAHRQICHLCGEVCRVDFYVSSEHWQLGMPKHLWTHHVCLTCYTKQADERHIPWCESIQLKPKSQIRHIEEMFNWKQLELEQ